jgi:hypothetical protein
MIFGYFGFWFSSKFIAAQLAKDFFRQKRVDRPKLPKAEEPTETLPTERPLNVDACAYDGGVEEEEAAFDMQQNKRANNLSVFA